MNGQVNECVFRERKVDVMKDRFLTHFQTSSTSLEKLQFSDVFREYRNEAFVEISVYLG